MVHDQWSMTILTIHSFYYNKAWWIVQISTSKQSNMTMTATVDGNMVSMIVDGICGIDRDGDDDDGGDGCDGNGCQYGTIGY